MSIYLLKLRNLQKGEKFHLLPTWSCVGKTAHKISLHLLISLKRGKIDLTNKNKQKLHLQKYV